MKNYEYIIAGLPVIDDGFKFGENSPEQFIEEIRAQLDKKDNLLVDFLLKAYDVDNLTEEFYSEALKQRNSFLREFIIFDLNLRNAKVRYLNKALGRPSDKDVITLCENDEPTTLVFEEEAAVNAVLAKEDLLAREKGLDDLTWDKISKLTVFNYFDINVILAFIAKMQVTARWYKLDEETGRAMFRKLVNEVRGTFKGVDYKEA